MVRVVVEEPGMQPKVAMPSLERRLSNSARAASRHTILGSVTRCVKSTPAFHIR